MKKKNVSRSFVSKVVAILLVVMTLASLFTVSVSAASWPSLSTSSYCEFTAPKTIYVYRNQGCTTPGTCSPAKSYKAYIDPGDKCKIIQITDSYVKLQYPTPSGYKTAFAKRWDIFGVSYPTETITSKGKVDTYTKAGGSYYGYVATGDRVYACGTSGSYTAVIYQAKSGSRAYKLGYVRTSDYNNIIKKPQSNNTTSITNNSGSFFQWPMSNYYVTNAFNRYSSSKAKVGRPYHSGMDIKSDTNTDIYAAASGKVVYKGYYGDNGNHIVIEHNFNGTTVKTLYSHLKNFNGCPDVGGYVTKGQKIGVMGNTGYSTGPHLHFAIYTGSSNSPVGYGASNGSNKLSHNYHTFYNPEYVIKYNKLP